MTDPRQEQIDRDVALIRDHLLHGTPLPDRLHAAGRMAQMQIDRRVRFEVWKDMLRFPDD